MKTLSLFSGAGGLDAGLVSAGVELVAHCEIEAKCHPVLEARFPGVPVLSDVTAIADRWDVDLIAGGPPCQDNSVANSSGKGVKGARSGLVWRMLDIVEASQPRAVLIENVMGLKSRGLWSVCERLGSMGYGVEVTRVRASDFGWPHRRERLVVLGYRGVVAPGGDGWARVDRAGVALPRWGENRDAGMWNTPVASDVGRTTKYAQGGTALSAQVREWPTPRASGGGARRGDRGTSNGVRLIEAVRNWPTPAASDYKGASKLGQRRGQLAEAVPDAAGWTGTGPLNPVWVEALMGWPMGWTDPAADLVALPGPVMGRGPDQHAWEPPRMVAPRSLRGRPSRIKMCGNGVVNGLGQMAMRRIREVLNS